MENSAVEETRVALAALFPMSPTADTLLDRLGENATAYRAASSATQVVRSMLGGVVLSDTHARIALAEQPRGFQTARVYANACEGLM